MRTPLTELRARPVRELPGVGPRIEAALKDLGVRSVADMISHYPSRHEDLSNVKRIGDLRVGDRITAVDGREIKEPGDLSSAILEHKPGDRIELEVVRDGEQRTIDVELGTRPDQAIQR